MQLGNLKTLWFPCLRLACVCSKNPEKHVLVHNVPLSTRKVFSKEGCAAQTTSLCVQGVKHSVTSPDGSAWASEMDIAMLQREQAFLFPGEQKSTEPARSRGPSFLKPHG